MSDPYLGEVRIFAGNFEIRGWAFCDGQLLPTAQAPALFSLLGSIYGGDDRYTFGLPNLQDRVALHAGTGKGLTSRKIGQVGGARSVALTERQLPSHRHALSAVAAQADVDVPASNVTMAELPGGGRGAAVYREAVALVALAKESVAPNGGSQQHNNEQPTQVVSFLISLTGDYYTP